MCACTAVLPRVWHRHMHIEPKGHAMIRTRGLRGLAVALFVACAAMAATPVAQADLSCVRIR